MNKNYNKMFTNEQDKNINEKADEVVTESDDKEKNKAMVTCAMLHLRDQPSKGDNVINILPAGTVIEVIENDSEWSKVMLDDGVEGYVMSEYIMEC